MSASTAWTRGADRAKLGRMSRYKARLTRDLDRWIAEGMVPAASATAATRGWPRSWP